MNNVTLILVVVVVLLLIMVLPTETFNEKTFKITATNNSNEVMSMYDPDPYNNCYFEGTLKKGKNTLYVPMNCKGHSIYAHPVIPAFIDIATLIESDIKLEPNGKYVISKDFELKKV